MADAAATIIANAVDLPNHPAIVRVPAREIAPDNDLGGRLVTRAVGELTPREIAQALHSGVVVARQLISRGLICAAAFRLQGQSRVEPQVFRMMTLIDHPDAESVGSVMHV